MIQLLLRKMGLVLPAVPAPDEQTYAEAQMDNAVIDSTRSVNAITEVAKASGAANAKLRAGIDRLKMSGDTQVQTLARASHRPRGR